MPISEMQIAQFTEITTRMLRAIALYAAIMLSLHAAGPQCVGRRERHGDAPG